MYGTVVCFSREKLLRLLSACCVSWVSARELVKLHYLGLRRIVKERDSPECVGSFIDDLVDGDGSPN